MKVLVSEATITTHPGQVDCHVSWLEVSVRRTPTAVPSRTKAEPQPTSQAQEHRLPAKNPYKVHHGVVREIEVLLTLGKGGVVPVLHATEPEGSNEVLRCHRLAVSIVRTDPDDFVAGHTVAYRLGLRSLPVLYHLGPVGFACLSHELVVA